MRRAWVFVVVLFVAAGCGGSRARLVLPRTPYLGLACRNPTLACTRVGLGVWTPWRARRVTATVGRSRFALFTSAGRGAYAGGRFWQGFFRNRSVAAKAARFAPVRLLLVVVDSAGAAHPAAAIVRVSQGYG